MTAKLILASASPRRRALLEQLDLPFRVITADVDERVLPGETPGEYVVRTAAKKAWTVNENAGDALRLPVLAADTTVVLDKQILGKPADGAEAAAMLQKLSGQTHEVYSGVVVLAGEEERHRLSVSRVTFAEFEPEWIEAYCLSGEPLDKAGAYGVQGHAAQFISRLEGSYSGVMGLPLFETMQLLREAGIRVIPQPAAVNPI